MFNLFKKHISANNLLKKNSEAKKPVITITFDDKGQLSVSGPFTGPVENKLYCLKMLASASQAIINYQEVKPKIKLPGLADISKINELKKN